MSSQLVNKSNICKEFFHIYSLYMLLAITRIVKRI